MHILVLGGTGGIGPILIRELLGAGHTLVVYARSPQKIASDISSHPGVVVVKGELNDAAAVKAALCTPVPVPASASRTDGDGDGDADTDTDADAAKSPTTSASTVHAVVSALGPPVSVLGALRYPSNTPLAHGYAVLVDTMRALGLSRLIALGTASMPDPRDKRDAFFAAMAMGVHVSAPKAYKDVVAVNKVIRESGLGEVPGPVPFPDANANANVDEGDMQTMAVDPTDPAQHAMRAERVKRGGWTIARVPVLTNGETREYQLGWLGDGSRTTTLTRVGFAAFVVDELERVEYAGQAPFVTMP